MYNQTDKIIALVIIALVCFVFGVIVYWTITPTRVFASPVNSLSTLVDSAILHKTDVVVHLCGESGWEQGVLLSRSADSIVLATDQDNWVDTIVWDSIDHIDVKVNDYKVLQADSR